MSGSGKKKGYAPPTGAQLYLKRSAQECGLDDRNLRTLQDITRPKLFPNLLWHSNGSMWSGEDDITAAVGDSTGTATLLPPPVQPISTPKRQSSTIYLIQKGREIQHRFQTSPQYVRATADVDVVRYRNQHHKRSRTTEPQQFVPDQAALEHYYHGVATEALVDSLVLDKYIPQELCATKLSMTRSNSQQAAANVNAAKRANLSLEEWEAREAKRRREGEEANPKHPDGDDEGSLGEPEDADEEEAEDYITNHYESEGEESGGGDNAEPTF